MTRNMRNSKRGPRLLRTISGVAMATGLSLTSGQLGCQSPPHDPGQDLPAGLWEEYAPNVAHPFGRLNPEAPPEVAQYDFMVGDFVCQLEYKKFHDGAWMPGQAGRAIWRAEYIMNGHGILDEFRDEWGSKNVNVRIFSEERGAWSVHWTAVNPTVGQVFEARKIGDAMVMDSERTTASGFVYTQRISFYDIREGEYSWATEVVNKDGSSVVIGTIECQATRDSLFTDSEPPLSPPAGPLER